MDSAYTPEQLEEMQRRITFEKGDTVALMGFPTEYTVTRAWKNGTFYASSPTGDLIKVMARDNDDYIILRKHDA